MTAFHLFSLSLTSINKLCASIYNLPSPAIIKHTILNTNLLNQGVQPQSSSPPPPKRVFTVPSKTSIHPRKKRKQSCDEPYVYMLYQHTQQQIPLPPLVLHISSLTPAPSCLHPRQHPISPHCPFPFSCSCSSAVNPSLPQKTNFLCEGRPPRHVLKLVPRGGSIGRGRRKSKGLCV